MDIFKYITVSIISITLLCSPAMGIQITDKIVVMPLRSNSLSESEKELFETKLKEGFTSRYDVYSGDVVLKKMAQYQLTECAIDECYKKITSEFNTSIIGTASVEKESEGYSLNFLVRDVYTGQDIETYADFCNLCDKSSALDKIKAMAAGGITLSTPAFLSPIGTNGTTGITRITPTVSGEVNSDMAVLIFDTEPSGTRVYIGNAEAGMSPFQQSNLKAGQTILITVKKDLYKDRTVQVTLSSGINELEDIVLEPNFGSLQIISDPAGADVLLAGKKVGQTPYYDKEVSSGAYLLTVESPRYLPVTNEVKVINGQETSLHFDLIANFGILSIASLPAAAEVIIYNTQGETVENGFSPAEFELRVGSYTVEISKQGYEPLEFKADVAKESYQVIEESDATLRPYLGYVMVSSEPYHKGASIIVDGRNSGQKVPDTLTLPEGSHEISVLTQELEGSMSVQIMDGETGSIVVPLSARSYKHFAIYLAADYLPLKLDNNGITFTLLGFGYRYFHKKAGYFRWEYFTGSSTDSFYYLNSSNGITSMKEENVKVIRFEYDYPYFHRIDGTDLVLGAGYEKFTMIMKEDNGDEQAIINTSPYLTFGVVYNANRFFIDAKARYVFTDDEYLDYAFGLAVSTGIRF